MSQEQVIDAVEETPAFNPEAFSGKKTPSKEEVTQEPIVVESNEPIETNQIENEFEVSFENDIVDTPKRSIYESLKEIDPDLEDEDTAVSKYKNFKEENEKLKIIAKGRSIIDSDEDIIAWNKQAKMSETDKARAAIYLEHINKGFDHEKAIAKAEKKIEEWIESESDQIEDKAVEYTSFLKRNIENKTKHIEETILASNVSLDIDDKTIEKTSSEISNINDFLGMQLPKDADKKAKILKDAGDYAKSKEFVKALKDPKVLSEVAMYLKYKETWAKNIKQKSVSKATLLDKMATAPSVKASVVERSAPIEKGGFNPKTFK